MYPFAPRAFGEGAFVGEETATLLRSCDNPKGLQFSRGDGNDTNHRNPVGNLSAGTLSACDWRCALDGMCATDEGSITVDVNDVFRKVVGREAEEIKEMSLYGIIDGLTGMSGAFVYAKGNLLALRRLPLVYIIGKSPLESGRIAREQRRDHPGNNT